MVAVSNKQRDGEREKEIKQKWTRKETEIRGFEKEVAKCGIKLDTWQVADSQWTAVYLVAELVEETCIEYPVRTRAICKNSCGVCFV